MLWYSVPVPHAAACFRVLFLIFVNFVTSYLLFLFYSFIFSRKLVQAQIRDIT